MFSDYQKNPDGREHLNILKIEVHAEIELRLRLSLTARDLY